eukprot:TRINITY_DN1307_c0_g1_i1.p1 TRINITY_DN1307_c0_g1~~TRINITY_DN1307_c0_g1_i1.p1  ORF type:complete len:326 (+),score=70.38 TRINITY_DN1307_c0_g1_i1:76-978(+)
MSIDIKLSKVDRIYKLGDTVRGVIAVSTSGSLSHNGISLTMHGEVTLQQSAKSVGIFEAFYNSVKPVVILNYTVDVAKPGKVPDGVTELPFEFRLEPAADQELHETYHGVFVNIQYSLQCDVQRRLLAKNLQKRLEFIVEATSYDIPKPKEVPFTITPQSLQNIKKSSSVKVPEFKITGLLNSATCDVGEPLTGELTVEHSDAVIRSIELQLARVETCGSADGYAKEATEIQNIQIADGDICHGMSLPLYMVFPRLFTCPSVASGTFKIEFEVNLVVMLEDGHLISENFPIQLTRRVAAQ